MGGRSVLDRHGGQNVAAGIGQVGEVIGEFGHEASHFIPWQSPSAQFEFDRCQPGSAQDKFFLEESR